MRTTAFADLPQLVLGPLAGRPDADWHRAPPGKWSPAQIVQHLAIGIDGSARTFESRRAHAPMRRRPRTVRGRLKTPAHKVHRSAKQYRRRGKHRRPLDEGE